MSLGSLLTKTSDNVLLWPSTSSSFNSRTFYALLKLLFLTCNHNPIWIPHFSTLSNVLLSTVCSHRRCLHFYGLIKCKQNQSFNRVTHKHTHAQGRISALIATFCWNWHLTKLTLFQTAFSLIFLLMNPSVEASAWKLLCNCWAYSEVST